jgi:ABC-type transporter Mla subunit MlaD
MKAEHATYGTHEHFSERVQELKKVLERLHKHGSAVQSHWDNLNSIVQEMENTLAKLASAD